MEELDSLPLERIAWYLEDVDLQSFAQAYYISHVPAIKKRLDQKTCALCNYSADTLVKIYKHYRNKHQMIQCSYCPPENYRWRGQYLYKRHVYWQHRDSKRHLCLNCKKQYSWKSSLNRHQKFCRGKTV